MIENDFNLIDLYCGCGGFGLGAHLAGFNVKLAVDLDATLSSAYKKNFPNTDVKNYDLASTSTTQLLNDIDNTHISGVIGGPPCQGFSHIGKKDSSDPRNELLHHYFIHVQNIQPDFFIMENVPGLLSKDTRGQLDDAIAIVSSDYRIIGPIILDACDFGVPTSRKRAVVIGYRPEKVSHFDEADIKGLIGHQRTNIKEAIYGLPEPKNFATDDFGWAKIDKRTQQSIYAKQSMATPHGSFGDPDAIKKLKKGFVSGFMNTVHSDKVANRYNSITPGMVDKTSKSIRLKWTGLSPTLRAGTGSDKGSFQAVRPIHPQHGRVITVREAARIQGFPDWYVFHPTKWHSFRMIGNSVSPIFSKALLSFIRGQLISKRQSQAPLKYRQAAE